MKSLTRLQVREVDRLAIEDYGMSGLVLMENAGRGCVDVLCRCGVRGRVVVCCGRGNNGGDGFVIARHLELRGFAARVLIWNEPQSFHGDAAANLEILIKSAADLVNLDGGDDSGVTRQLADADWIVDALLGTGARGAPRPPLDRVIELLNQVSANKLAVDLPSGLDCDTGEHEGAVFRADHTCTFVAAKPGLLVERAKDYVGELHVLDIGAPRRVLECLGD